MAHKDRRGLASEHLQKEQPKPPHLFPSTIWMRIEKLKDSTPSQARPALSELCEAYWHPVYAFIRRKGYDPDRAADLTQGFFALLIEPGSLGGHGG